jgi:hypothetical protein
MRQLGGKGIDLEDSTHDEVGSLSVDVRSDSIQTGVLDRTVSSIDCWPRGASEERRRRSAQVSQAVPLHLMTGSKK